MHPNSNNYKAALNNPIRSRDIDSSVEARILAKRIKLCRVTLSQTRSCVFRVGSRIKYVIPY